MQTTLFLMTYAALWLLVIALLAAVFFLYRHLGQQLVNSREGRAAQGPPVGTPLPRAHLRDLEGRALELGRPSARPVFLFLTATTCRPCQEALQTFAGFAERHGAAADMLLVCRGATSREVAEFTAGLPASVRVVPDTRWDLGGRLRIFNTPFALIADREGLVRGLGVPQTAESFAWFIEQVEVAAGQRQPNVRLIPVAPAIKQ